MRSGLCGLLGGGVAAPPRAPPGLGAGGGGILLLLLSISIGRAAERVSQWEVGSGVVVVRW
jgi:hypothetical protein